MENENVNAKRAKGTALLLEQVARRMLEKRGHDDLHAAQWSALRYFARAGRRTANVIGLSRYLGNTSGSTSRTARSLVERELVAVSPADHDARSVMFSLTDKGRDALAADPLGDLVDILCSLPPDDLAHLSETLDRLHTELGRRRAGE